MSRNSEAVDGGSSQGVVGRSRYASWPSRYLGEIKESVNSGLLWASKQGPLAEENMRGIRFTNPRNTCQSFL